MFWLLFYLSLYCFINFHEPLCSQEIQLLPFQQKKLPSFLLNSLCNGVWMYYDLLEYFFLTLHKDKCSASLFLTMRLIIFGFPWVINNEIMKYAMWETINIRVIFTWKKRSDLTLGYSIYISYIVSGSTEGMLWCITYHLFPS